MLNLTGFIGEVPRTHPRLLPDSAAQIARNCKLVDGAIMPLRYPGDHRVLATGNAAFYKQGETWFEWSKPVDVVNAPIARNRLYFTGDGPPKIVTDASVVYPLAVKSPEKALTATVTGTPDPATQETITYVYTYVTAYDEESEPSPASNEVTRSYGMEITLTGFVTPPTDRNYNRVRLYRSQTSALGATDYYFVAEIVLPVPTTYLDLPEENPIQEPIPSKDYNPPPDDLQGIIALPNGMMAAFAGNKLYFSEPWLPHAWPEKYALTTGFDIVGLGAFGRSVAIMTTGNPYIATGITPDAMAMELIEVNLPCVNKRGIVDLGYSVAYPSNDGLVVVSSQGANLVSRNLFTRDQWQELSPETMVAAQFDGRYVACYSYKDKAGATQQGSMIIDINAEQSFLSRSDIYSTYLHYELGSGRLYFLSGQIAKEFDAQRQPFMQMTWRSKEFTFNGDSNFGVAMADSNPNATTLYTGTPEATVYDATFVSQPFSGAVVNGSTGSQSTGPEFEAVVYADGSPVRTFADLNRVARLPGGFLARKWEIEVRGRRAVEALYLAWAPSELYIGAA